MISIGAMWLAAFVLVGGWSALAHALAFTGEHGGQTIQMLKLTRLKPEDYFNGKWICCWRLRAPVTMVAAGITTLFTGLRLDLSGQDSWTLAACGGIAFPLLIEALGIISSQVAFRARTVGRTLIWTFLFSIILGWVICILLMLFSIAIAMNDAKDVETVAPMMYMPASCIRSASCLTARTGWVGWLFVAAFLLGWGGLSLWDMNRCVDRLWKEEKEELS